MVKPTCQQCNKRKAYDFHSPSFHKIPDDEIWLCKKCHDEIHNIPPRIGILGLQVRQFWDTQKIRVALEGRIRAYKQYEYPVENLEKNLNSVKGIEKDIQKEIRETCKTHKMWNEIKQVKGIGPILFAALISEIRDPMEFSNPSKVWKFFGLHTVEGKAPKRKRGQKLGFSIWRRTIAWKIGDSFNKNRNRSQGGKLLKRYHEFYKERDGDKLSKGHVLNRAKRKTVKVFLACFWSKWLKLEGGEPTEPYAKKLGHSNFINWDYFKEK